MPVPVPKVTKTAVPTVVQYAIDLIPDDFRDSLTYESLEVMASIPVVFGGLPAGVPAQYEHWDPETRGPIIRADPRASNPRVIAHEAIHALQNWRRPARGEWVRMQRQDPAMAYMMQRFLMGLGYRNSQSAREAQAYILQDYPNLHRLPSSMFGFASQLFSAPPRSR